MRGTCNRGGRAGAVLAKDGRVISFGYAGSVPGGEHCIKSGCLIIEGESGCKRTLHAESNAILWAARMGISTEGCTLYCTISPCISCAKNIVQAGINEVHYIQRYRSVDGISFLVDSGVLTHKHSLPTFSK